VLSLAPWCTGADAAARARQILEAAEALRPKLLEQRRDFHMHPELSNQEQRTARVVAERLRALGLDDVKTGVANHGVVALLKGGRPGPVVAVRADMDALPITQNDPRLVEETVPTIRRVLGEANVATFKPLMGSEDFSYYQQVVPGFLFFLGVGNPAKGLTAGWHTAEFDVTRNASWLG
jgi:amidohydrolase